MKDSLFVLIKSLSKSEKGYFKKYSNFHGRSREKNTYVKIFDAINLQVTYNEPKLLRKFRNESFINQFSVAKNYLYNTILDCLETYHKSITIELRSILTWTEILLEKGLLTQAKKMLRKAKKLAEKHAMSSYIVEINLKEQEIFYFENDFYALRINTNRLASENKKALKQIENKIISKKEKKIKKKELMLCL